MATTITHREANLYTMVSISSVLLVPTNNAINPDRKQVHMHQLNRLAQWQLRSSVSLRRLDVYKKVVDLTTVNVLRPYSVYNRALTRQIPDPMEF